MRVLRLPTLAGFLLAACAAVHGAAPADPFAGGRWVDLTHDYAADTLYWPTADGFALEVEFKGVTPQGYFYAANRFRTSEHGGTHLDAPIHFARDRRTVDRIPLDQLIGAAAVVDVRSACAADPDHEVGVGELQAWEQRHGRIPDGAILLLNTGFAARWPDAVRYLGTAEKGPAAVAKLRFPGLAPAAARWLATERRLKAVGIDTASIDHGPSTHFGSHVILCGGNVPIFENLADLAGLPEQGTFVVALPMKIAGGSGGPLRIVARLPDAGD
jgi:kynurenine formamidase